MTQALSLSKLAGAYHYVDGSGVDAEAKHFVDTVKPYLGKIILCIDWEAGGNSKFSDHTYCIKLLNKVKELTGITPFVYMSKSACRAHDWSKATQYPLWCAQYAKANTSGSVTYQAKPWTDSKGFGAWRSAAIYQYSDHGRLPGYNGNLDLDIAYIDRQTWLTYCGVDATKPVVVAAPTAAKKTVTEVAQEVIDGKWGAGEDRKKKLAAAGYDYNEVQKAVNSLLKGNKTSETKKKSIDEIAKEVIAGKWGSGTARKKKITEAGYDYTAVQKRVNELSKKKK
jgi:hypothetical protein